MVKEHSILSSPFSCTLPCFFQKILFRVSSTLLDVKMGLQIRVGLEPKELEKALFMTGLCWQSDFIGEVRRQHAGKSSGVGSTRKKIIACDALLAISVNG